MKTILLSLTILAALSVCQAYSPERAYNAFQYSKISYCPNNKLHNWNCGVDCDSKPGVIWTLVNNNIELQSQSYVAYNEKDDEIIVAQRGTSNIRNWISDFKADKIVYPGCPSCFIHRGFYNVYNTFADVIMREVKILKEKYPTAKLIVTGHSLGGATAVITALEIFHQTGYKADEVITFGQPRVGNQYFADYFHKIFPNFVRLVHYKDVVPHVAPQNLGYAHSPTEVWYYTEIWDKYTVCSSIGEDHSCSDSLLLIDSVSDHLKYFGEYTGCSKDNNSDELEAEQPKSFLQ